MSAETPLQVVFLGSGSAGNATVIAWEGYHVLLDCGFAPTELQSRLDKAALSPEMIDAVLITHEHGDHAAGLPLFKKREGLPVVATGPTARAIRFGKRARCEPVLISPRRSQQLGPFEVIAFRASHDATDPVGFVLVLPDGTRIGFATDLGKVTKVAVDALDGCSLLAVEANHDPQLLHNGPYPWALKRRIRSVRGHLSNDDAAWLVGQVASEKLRHIFLMHLSETNNRPELARQVLGSALSRQRLRPTISIVEQNKILRYPLAGQLTLF